MHRCHFFSVLPGSIMPYTFLLNAAVFFAVVVGGMLLFIAFYLVSNHQKQLKKKKLCDLFSDLIAETTICESEEERRTTLHRFLSENTAVIRRSFARRVLVWEIVRTKENISGGAAENLRWLYETLDLDRDTLKLFSSDKWHRKACAIQHLAAMQQNKHLVKIYRETNNKNSLIRTEAQIAVVKLTGFKGLRFLSIVSHPVSQWQQLALISQLQEGEIEEDNIGHWLHSKNDSVVEFALRLIEVYKCYTLHPAVVKTLQHPSLMIRLQALQALKEINNGTTLPTILYHFTAACKEEQIRMLDMLQEIGAGIREIHFLTTLLQHQDEAIRYRAIHLIQQISPAWSNVIIRRIKGNPSFTYILSSLAKKAV